jgi:aarF domain-containing kinase
LNESQQAAGGQGKQSGTGKPGKKWIKYGVIGGVILVGAVTFSSDAKHLYRAAERTGRVVGTLAVCINE